MSTEIWKGYNDDGTPFGVIKGIKKDFSRNNLRIYMDTFNPQDICKESFLEFFNESTISSFDPVTGYYLPHLLFLDEFEYEKVTKILEFAFEYISQHQVTEKEGYSYLSCMFQKYKRLKEKEVYNILEQAIDLNVNFNQVDYNGDTIMHWAIAGGGYMDEIDNIYPYFPDAKIMCAENKQSITSDLLMYLISLKHYLVDGLVIDGNLIYFKRSGKDIDKSNVLQNCLALKRIATFFYNDLFEKIQYPSDHLLSYDTFIHDDYQKNLRKKFGTYKKQKK